jgi:hypothetical protein
LFVLKDLTAFLFRALSVCALPTPTGLSPAQFAIVSDISTKGKLFLHFLTPRDQIRPVRQGLKSAIGQAPRRESERWARICPDVVDSGRRWNGQDGQLRFSSERRPEKTEIAELKIDQNQPVRYEPVETSRE